MAQSYDPNNQEQDEEHQVEDVVIEFEGNFELDALANKQVQLIGIDTDEPILKLDSKFYKVDIKDSIGTRLILSPDHQDSSKEHQGSGSAAKTPPPAMNYLTKTDKVITASRVMIKPRAATRTERVLSKDT